MQATEKNQDVFYTGCRNGFIVLALIFTLIMVIFWLPGCAWAGGKIDWTRGWDKTDTALQTMTTAAIGWDWMQTYQAQARHQRNDKGQLYQEVGSAKIFIGEHPSGGRINSYFTACVLGHAAVAYLLPKKVDVLGFHIPARNLWQAFWIGVEINQGVENYQAGVRLKF